MTPIELLADVAGRNLEFLKWTVGELTDAELMIRPCPGANHGRWQLAHLVNAEAFFNGLIQAGAFTPPESFKGKYGKEDAKVDDAAYFPSKAQSLELLSAGRAVTVKLIKGLTPADLAKPTPEQVQKFAPTIGHVAAVIADHTTMHVGQLQVLRRKLGKSILF